MKLDLRERCGHCGKLIRSKLQLENYTKHYRGYCTFACQEYAAMKRTLELLRKGK